MAELEYTLDGQKFMDKLEELCHLTVSVGFQNGVTNKSGEDIASYAYYNQYGTSTIPARPFMSDAFDKHEDEIHEFVASAASQVCAGGDVQQALNQIGAYGKGLIQSEIVDGEFVPNAPSTIRKKGKGSRPLIDTGAMRQSVQYTISEEGEEE